MEQILEIINAIATPEFMNKYDYLNDYQNRLNDTENYKILLQKWFLFKEIDLLNNNSTVLGKVRGISKTERVFKQPILKKGEYNSTRYNSLKDLIK